MLDPNGKYLRQLTTGQIFGFEPEFAKRSDMVPYRPGQDVTDVEVLTIDTRVRTADVAPVEEATGALAAPAAVATTADGFSGRGVMGAILGDG